MKFIFVQFLLFSLLFTVGCNKNQPVSNEEANTTPTEEPMPEKKDDEAEKSNDDLPESMIARLGENIELSEAQKQQIRALGADFNFSGTTEAQMREDRKKFRQLVIHEVLTADQKGSLNNGRTRH